MAITKGLKRLSETEKRISLEKKRQERRNKLRRFFGK